MGAMDNIALASSVSYLADVDASATHTTTTASMITDCNEDTGWNAGKFPPSSVTMTLKASDKPIEILRLIPAQSPNGNTIHEVLITTNNNDWALVRTVKEYTSNKQPIVLKFNPPLMDVKKIKINTINSPSWVSWLEIQAYSSEAQMRAGCKYSSPQEAIEMAGTVEDVNALVAEFSSSVDNLASVAEVRVKAIVLAKKMEDERIKLAEQRRVQEEKAERQRQDEIERKEQARLKREAALPPQAMYLQAGKYDRQGSSSDAKRLYETLIEKYPNHPLAIKANDQLQSKSTSMSSSRPSNTTCSHLYIGKAVSYKGCGALWCTTVEGVITGIGDGVATMRVTGSEYNGDVIEKPCSKF